jgi:hypothetical protein
MQLLLPEDLREKMARRYQNQHRQWLGDAGVWPLVWKLGSPAETFARQHPAHVLAWVSSWQSWQGKGEVVWCEKNWRTFGKQRLPEKLILNNVSDIAAWVGETQRWEKAESRYKQLITKWPSLAACLPRYFEILADYSVADIERLDNVLAWISAHPRSNLYPRQLPIAGLDSKWLEQRKELITTLVTALHNDATLNIDFYRRCGLKQPPSLMRLRVLDSALRAYVGGLDDITAPVHSFAALKIPASRVYIVENLQTGLAFSDLPGTVVIVGLGYHVDVLEALPWLSQAKCFYWGDIDTHGFAILNRARSYLPELQSFLMDHETLLQHETLWGNEDKQHAAMELPLLNIAEQALYYGLKQQSWGSNVRLEQEKIGWDFAWEQLRL